MIKDKIIAAMHRFRSDEGGAITAVVAIAMVMILACAALVVDLGSTYQNKIKLQNAVDNAVRTAGYSLPCALSDEDDVIAVIKTCMAENGFPEGKVTLSYDWTCNSKYDYGVRVSATADVGYVFASALGSDAGIVTATAKITCAPVTSTFKAISVYIEKSSFENQLANIKADQSFTITISANGASNNNNSGNMGIMHIVPSGDEVNYVTYDGWSESETGDPHFFEEGYWQWVQNKTTGKYVKTGISVGDTRTIENADQIYEHAYTGLSARITKCEGTCKCSKETHLNSCPRIALLPVVTTTSGRSTSGKGYGGPGGSSSGTATIQYFVAIYIESVVKNGTTTTITACYLDDYRETSDVDDSNISVSAAINPLMACSTTFEE